MCYEVPRSSVAEFPAADAALPAGAQLDPNRYAAETPTSAGAYAPRNMPNKHYGYVKVAWTFGITCMILIPLSPLLDRHSSVEQALAKIIALTIVSSPLWGGVWLASYLIRRRRRRPGP